MILAAREEAGPDVGVRKGEEVEGTLENEEGGDEVSEEAGESDFESESESESDSAADVPAAPAPAARRETQHRASLSPSLNNESNICSQPS